MSKTNFTNIRLNYNLYTHTNKQVRPLDFKIKQNKTKNNETNTKVSKTKDCFQRITKYINTNIQKSSTTTEPKKDSEKLRDHNLEKMIKNKDKNAKQLRTILQGLTLKQKDCIISMLCLRLRLETLNHCQTPLFSLTDGFSNCLISSDLIRKCLNQEDISYFDQLLCKNVLFKVISTIPKDQLLPINFFLEKLLDMDRCFLLDLKPYLKSKEILNIWVSLVGLWKHEVDNNVLSIGDISTQFGAEISKMTLSQIKQLNFSEPNREKSKQNTKKQILGKRSIQKVKSTHKKISGGDINNENNIPNYEEKTIEITKEITNLEKEFTKKYDLSSGSEVKSNSSKSIPHKMDTEISIKIEKKTNNNTGYIGKDMIKSVSDTTNLYHYQVQEKSVITESTETTEMMETKNKNNLSLKINDKQFFGKTTSNSSENENTLETESISVSENKYEIKTNSDSENENDDNKVINLEKIDLNSKKTIISSNDEDFNKDSTFDNLLGESVSNNKHEDGIVSDEDCEDDDENKEFPVKTKKMPRLTGDLFITTSKKFHKNCFYYFLNDNKIKKKRKKYSIKRKESKRKNSNNKGINKLNNKRIQIVKEDNLWAPVTCVLTSKKIRFTAHQTLTKKKIASIGYQDLIIFQKNNIFYKTGFEDYFQDSQDSRLRINISASVRNSKNIKIHPFPYDINSSFHFLNKNKLFVISNKNFSNYIICKSKSKIQREMWVSEILKRKNSLINNTHYIYKQLSLNGFRNNILNNLLVSKNMSLVSAILQNFDSRRKQKNLISGEKLARSLVYIFHSKSKGLRLVRWMVNSEINNGKNTSKTLFRSSSVSSKIIPIYGFLIGNEFLVKTLTSSIDMIRNIKRYLDVDKNNVSEEQVKKNIAALKILSNELIGKILFSIRDIPLSIRIIGRAMRKAARRIFPESSYSSINNFIFLRFLVPVVIAPQNFGVIEKEKKINLIFKKNLILISKIVQNVGNQSEGFIGPLSCLDDYIKSSSVRIIKFYQVLTDLTTVEKSENRKLESELYPLKAGQLSNALKTIKQYLYNNINDIRDTMLHSDSRTNYVSFVSDFIENLIEDEEDEEFDNYDIHEKQINKWLNL
ncbi:neurofibromin [Anaeramoeba flamelloides]|uniref:Neurofibromin n=1 Tax=Anaeramoeba flamelloides TaxID=1746091 RepID=A0ABQ8YG94_9EUKA|nr:neurofibromin [Anaeramoeba flamelloides]